jgi:3-oxoacyl-[acyl-carrier-protein] synthase-3
MPENIIKGVRLKGISAVVPKLVEDNASLTLLAEKQRNDIIETVGIRYRRLADGNLTSADLCTKAAQQLLEELSWTPESIDILVFVSQTPDHLVPGSATQIHDRLQMRTDALCLDLNQGCAGYVYGMATIAGLMSSLGHKRGLLLVGDTITKMISQQDSSIWPIFSDAGTATAFELSDEGEMRFRFGSRGADFEAIMLKDGGYRHPITKESLKYSIISDGVCRRPDQLSMNGQAVFTFGLSTVAGDIKRSMDESGVNQSDIDYLVLHQANQFLMDSIARKVGFPKEKVPSSLFHFGNTSCATIPLTMATELPIVLRTRKLRLLLSGFGVGLSWGNVILETDQVVCPPIQEI